ncbi:MAG: SEC-C domain-containing protein [Pseudomonadota bacterium]
MKPGRNDPCPCGSGRKYKQCCLAAAAAAAQEPVNLLWRRVRRALDDADLVAQMMRFAVENYGEAVLDEAWVEFGYDDGPFDPESPHLGVFFAWMLHCWAPNPEITTVQDTSLHGVAPTRAYLERTRRVDPLVRQYLEACLASRFGFYELSQCRPGVGFQARDLFTGERFDVLEGMASQSMQDGDAMFALLVRLEGITLVETCGLYAIPPIKQLTLLELRQETAPGSDVLTPAQIAEHEEDLRFAYFDVTDSLANPQTPQLRNTDGDALVLQQLVFDIDSPQAAFDALAHLDITGSRDELLETAERDSAGELCRVQLTWSRRGNPVHKEWENTILASIEISGSRMTADVNSAERAAEFRRIVEQALGSRARYRMSELQSADKLAAVAQAAPVGAHGVDPELLESPELKARITEFIERHYESWVEQEIPALGGLTPLAAVREPGGREKVEALLRQAERDSQRMPQPVDPAMFERLRERLGLSPS